MREIKNILVDLKYSRPLEYNIENFYVPANDDRYNSYLNDVVLKYVKDKDEVLSYLEEQDIYGEKPISGVFNTAEGLKCIVPPRRKLIDEITNIHEITHLVSHLASFDNDRTTSKNIVPYFNEYEYLKRIHQFFADYYKVLRYNDAIDAAKRFNQFNYKDCLSYIYAYYILLDRENNYNIRSLNKINTNSKTLEKTLDKKGYTF